MEFVKVYIQAAGSASKTLAFEVQGIDAKALVKDGSGPGQPTRFRIPERANSKTYACLIADQVSPLEDFKSGTKCTVNGDEIVVTGERESYLNLMLKFACPLAPHADFNRDHVRLLTFTVRFYLTVSGFATYLRPETTAATRGIPFETFFSSPQTGAAAASDSRFFRNSDLELFQSKHGLTQGPAGPKDKHKDPWYLAFVVPAPDGPDKKPHVLRVVHHLDDKSWGDVPNLWPFDIRNNAAAALGHPNFAVQQDISAEELQTGRWQFDWITTHRVSELNQEKPPPDAMQSPLGRWNAVIASAFRHALHSVRAGEPLSALPHFGGIGVGDESTTHHDRLHWRSRYHISFAPPSLLPNTREWPLEKLTVEFQALELLAPESADPEVWSAPIGAQLPDFRCEDGKPLAVGMELQPLAPDDQSSVAGPKVCFAMREHYRQPHSPMEKPNEGQITQVGAMFMQAATRRSDESCWPSTRDGEAPITRVKLTGDLALILNPENTNPQTTPPSTTNVADLRWHFDKFDLTLAINAIGPAGQDPDPDDPLQAQLHQQPLTLPVQTEPALPLPMTGKFALLVNERNVILAPTPEDHHLRLTLERLKEIDESPPAEIVVLDSTPLLIAKVALPAFWTHEGDIAYWDIGDRGVPRWLTHMGTERSFILSLPPQAVAEDMLRRYGAADDYHPDPKEPLFFRYGMPAQAILRRGDDERSYAEPPWNLRRLLSETRSPGMWLTRLNFELLYGLTGTLEAPGTYLAELDAIVGHQPPVPETDKKYSDLYRDFSRRVRSRLGVLWPLNGPIYRGEIVFKEDKTRAQRIHRARTFREGLSFQFRDDRQVVDPIESRQAEATRPYSAPKSDQFHKWGVRGGADYGFEIERVYREALDSGVSSSAVAEQLALTSLAGQGLIVVRLADDKSEIDVKAFLGRIFYYSVTRVGRIGILWNKAQHAVIYERSIAAHPPAVNPDDGRAAWKHRPVLRKREYIELLQPERRYPESGASAPAAVGFLRGSKFDSRRITVDSSWARNAAGGVVIPLAPPPGKPPIQGADTLKVSFELLTATPSTDLPDYFQVDNPEQLVFYTSTREQTPHTDNWRAVPGVDFAVAQLPMVPNERPDATDARQPSPPAEERDYAPFTFRLRHSNRPLNLVAGRQPEPVQAVIESITLSRRALVAASDEILKSGMGQLRHAVRGYKTGDQEPTVDYLAALVLNAARKLEQGMHDDWASLQGSTNDALTEVVTALKNLKTLLEVVGKQDLVFPKALGTVDLFVHRQQARFAQWRSQVEGIVNEWTRLQQQIDSLGEPTAEQEVRLEELGQRLRLLLQAAPSALLELRAQLDRAKRLIETRLNEVQTRLQTIVDEVHKHVLAAQTRARALEAAALGIFGLLALVQQTMDDLFQQADRRQKIVLQELQQAVQDTVKAFINVIPLNDNDLATLKAKLQELLKTFKGDLVTVITKGLPGDLETLRGVLHELLAQDEKRLREEMEEILRLLETRLPNLDALLDRAKKLAPEALTAELQTAVEKSLLAVDGLLVAAGSTLVEIYATIQEAKGVLQQQVLLAVSLAGALKKELSTEGEHALRTALLEATALYRRFAARYERILDQLLADAEQILEAGTQDWDLGDTTMRLVRAYGAPPIAQGLELTRERVAYYFQKQESDVWSLLGDRIHLTPSVALVNRFGRELAQTDLKSLSLRIPTRELVRRFEPLIAGKYDLQQILPDIAGLNLTALFPDLRLPELLRDAHVTHGLDVASRRAWVRAEIAAQLHNEAVVFEQFGFRCVLRDGRFQAEMGVSTEVDGGGARQEGQGSVSGSWELSFNGILLLRMRDTRLDFFSSGKIHFHMDPKKLEFPAALQFLTDLIKGVAARAGDGLSIDIVPGGLRMMLRITPPAIGAGAFSISQLAFGLFFSLVMQDDTFTVTAGLSLSSKDRPFNMSVLFLGGGGWFTLGAGYEVNMASKPPKGRLTGSISAGIAVGAMLNIDLSFLRGCLFVLFYAGVELEAGTGSRGSVRMVLGLLMGGEVVLLGLVSMRMLIQLEARYETGGSLMAWGFIEVEVKLGWLFKLKVRRSFTYRISGTARTKSLDLDASASLPSRRDLLTKHMNCFA